MNIRVKLTESDQKINVKLSEKKHGFKATFRGLQPVTEYIGGERYIGDYIVTPKVKSQTLQTSGKVMEDNVTIKSIPFFNVSNTSGGSTVFIGNEV